MDLLEQLARTVRAAAYAPYSRFPVGAAVEDARGRRYAGVNVENSSYGLTLCGERNAIGQMVADGGTRVLRVVVVADSDKPTTPCGACRQVIAEFAEPDAEVVLVNLRDDARQSFRLADLLPHGFCAARLP
jgi:cytidine deaminase